MKDGGVQKVEIVFLVLLLFVAAFGALASRLKTPYPIVLVIAGLLLGFIPWIPKKVERQTAIRLRNEGRINDELLRQLERELDLVEARFLTGGA